MLCGLTRSKRSDTTDDSTPYSFPEKVSIAERPSEDEMQERLKSLQTAIHDNKLDYYVVPSEDEHQSEYVAEKDKRREWITGFNGSAGTAITPASSSEEAVLFVDSRYWQLAEGAIPKAGWKVIRVGATSGAGGAKVLGAYADYIKNEIPDGSRVGIDPKLMTQSAARSIVSQLENTSTQLISVNDNLVDQVRGSPEIPLNPFKHHPISFTGETTKSKLSRMREQLSLISGKSTEWIYLLPNLQPIAWLLNTRCPGDIPYTPTGFAYVLLTRKECFVFVDKGKVEDQALRKDWEDAGIQLKEYGVKEVVKVVNDLKGEVKLKNEKVKVKVLSSSQLSWALGDACAPVEIIPCPVLAAEAIKNPTEQEGLRQAYLRDGRAMVRWMSWLEDKLLKDKRELGEWAAIQTLTRFRRQERYNAGLAYQDISASGPHGAMGHYEPNRGEDGPVLLDSTYVADTGGQYLDGTIDTTRTYFFDSKVPDKFTRAYTRVLQGHMGVAMMTFPEGMDSSWMNYAARSPLYQEGMDFGHGLGHGVGSYLSVHEYPVSFPSGFPFQPGHVTTVEPGWYVEGDFGIRIESLYLCKEKEDMVPWNGKKWLEWERITQVPIMTNLVDYKLMSKDQIRWLNDHNTDVQNALMPLLQEDQDAEVREWLKKACKPKKIWPWTGQ